MGLIILSSDEWPTFTLSVGSSELDVLFDTGAKISVFTGTHALFKKKFPDAYKLPKYALLKGFGGEANKAHKCEMYIVPKIKLNNITTVSHLPIAISPMDTMPAEIILAGTILRKNIVTLGTSQMRMHISDDKPDIWCQMELSGTDDGCCIATYACAQEEVNDFILSRNMDKQKSALDVLSDIEAKQP